MANTGQEARGSDHARGRGFARYWPLTALLIMLAGVCLSGVVALSWSARVRREHRQAFEVTAGNVAATMTTLVQADANYVTTMRAILTIESHVSPTGFDDWYDWLEGARQQIGGVGIATIARIPFRQLRAFERGRDRDPAFTRLVGGMVQPVAPEGRRTECLLAAGHALIPLNPVIAYVAQTDLCDTSAPLGYVESGLLNQATASGQTVIRRYRRRCSRWRSIAAAFRCRRSPSAARRCAAGWCARSTCPTSSCRRSAPTTATRCRSPLPNPTAQSSPSPRKELTPTH
ncbi:MAG: hypothetical protein ACLP01_14345 [Solirubrobacteraceae bacterium]